MAKKKAKKTTKKSSTPLKDAEKKAKKEEKRGPGIDRPHNESDGGSGGRPLRYF